MIKIAPIDQIHGDTIIWRLVKRLGDFKPIDGAEYLVKKTRNAAPLIYRAANGRLQSTGDTLARWGFFDGPEDVIRVPARGRKS
jgi:hypothetical protein